LAQVALQSFVFEGPFTFADLLLAAGLALLFWLTLGVVFKYLADRNRKKEAG
jgi:hypothetical protein